VAESRVYGARVFHDTYSGTPQGGVIGPLLANIALHGMEAAVGLKYISRGDNVGKRCLILYADDFVVFCESEEDARNARSELSVWLASRGLALSDEKTRISYLSDGFDFLGFNIRRYRAPENSVRLEIVHQALSEIGEVAESSDR